MLCGMNFTTTGIECGTSRPRVLRVEYSQPLTAAVPLIKKQPAGGVPFLSTKATQIEKMTVVAPQVGQKRAAQDSSAKPKKARKKTFVEDPGSSSSSSSTSSSSSWSLPSSPSIAGAKDHNRRSAEPLEAEKWYNAEESSSSLGGDGHSCRLTKKDTTKAASAGQSTSKKSKSLASRKGHQGQNDSQSVQKKAVKGPPEKRVRFAMDVPKRILSPHPDPRSETSSSDGSDCSYIGLPPPTGLEDAISGYTHFSNASESHRYRPAPMTVVPQPAKHFTNKPFHGLPLRSKRQSATSRTPSRTRPPEPVVVMGSGLKKSNRKEPSSQLPAVIKTIMKSPSTGQRSTASNDDKENSLQDDERLGLTFRDL